MHRLRRGRGGAGAPGERGAAYRRAPRVVSEAETDATLRADILRYSRARGAFGGVSLEGSTIRPDNGANRKIYGREVPAKQIVLSRKVAIPPAAQAMISTLDSRTPRHKS